MTKDFFTAKLQDYFSKHNQSFNCLFLEKKNKKKKKKKKKKQLPHSPDQMDRP